MKITSYNPHPSCGFLLVGYVVMPNHVHLLMSEPKKGTPSTVLQMLKQLVSRKMRMRERAQPKGQLSLKFPKFITDLRKFWQPRFYDFSMYSHKKKKEKLEYMHANLVVRGLAEHTLCPPKLSMPLPIWRLFLFVHKVHTLPHENQQARKVRPADASHSRR